MKNKIILMIGISGFVFMSVSNAYAGRDVSSPYVSKGEWDLESKSEYVIDGDNDVDDTFEQSFEVGYGITEYLGIEAGIEFEDEPGEDFEAKSLEVETTIQLSERGEYFIDSGLKFKYEHSLLGGADELVGEVLLAKAVGKMSYGANIDVATEVGDGSDDGQDIGFDWKAAYQYSDHYAFGLEYYGSYGDTTDDISDLEHLLGPVAYGEIGEVEYEAGVLAGLTDESPDVTLKLNFEYEF